MNAGAARLTRFAGFNVAAAEWIKLRTVRSTWWILGGAVAVTLLVATGEAAELRAEAGAPGSVPATEPVMAVLTWLYFILGALGMLSISSEYATRGIIVTLACTPVRTRLLLAKAAVVGATVFAAAVSVIAVGVVACAPALGAYGRYDVSEMTGRVLAMSTVLALVAVLALGVGALVRRSAGTLTVLFGLLMVLPVALPEIAERWHLEFLATVAEHLPTAAGERFIAGEPALGLVLAAWPAGALAVGAWALRRRDA